MEKPYQGRAFLTEGINEFKIEIPAKKNWFILFFLTIWLGGWVIGMLFGSSVLFFDFDSPGPGIFRFFPIIWLAFWSIGGFFALRKWLWMVAGKEIATFDRGTLKIQRTAALFGGGPKTYNLNEMKHFNVNRSHSYDFDFASGNRNSLKLINGGAFSFDYGHRTIFFAEGIDVAEARIILEKLRAKKIIKDPATPPSSL